jgi:capsular polysaccharide export protein
MHQKKVFLFLQGLASPLFARLADELEVRGHCCLRINFCPGDRLFWPRVRGMHYHGRYDEWPSYLREVMQVHSVTDLILFGETRPLHHLAIAEAKAHGVRAHVFEEGYLRPYSITVEIDGTNANSSLPANAEFYLKAETGNQVKDYLPLPISATNRAMWNIAYQTANIFMPWAHPHYETHRPSHPLKEAAGWIRRLTRRFILGKKWLEERSLRKFLKSKKPFFFVPLQLDSDTQIICHSKFSRIQEFLDICFSSFASHAPAETWLVVKCHPLDNDLTPRGPMTKKLAEHYRISERVLFVDGGHLPSILNQTMGVVTVNSTVGTTALQHGRPVKALGHAIYDFDGLADQKPLDNFWKNPTKPDSATFSAFRNFLLGNCLVRGSFYSKEGIKTGVIGAADLLEKRIHTNAKQQS